MDSRFMDHGEVQLGKRVVRICQKYMLFMRQFIWEVDSNILWIDDIVGELPVKSLQYHLHHGGYYDSETDGKLNGKTMQWIDGGCAA